MKTKEYRLHRMYNYLDLVQKYIEKGNSKIPKSMLYTELGWSYIMGNEIHLTCHAYNLMRYRNKHFEITEKGKEFLTLVGTLITSLEWGGLDD